MLHSFQEPAIDGSTASMVCDSPSPDGAPYGGKLWVKPLLPEAAEIRKIGGPRKEF